MSFDDVKKRIVDRIKTKYKKINKESIFRDMILADVSHILTMALKNKEIKSFENVQVSIKEKIYITSTIWPFYGARINLKLVI